ncbi:Uncharacterized conserved protein YndB, AHSA1/START domain [Virgibacillus subterraneus]|uniref:Uncharacterized conserved protein YndB, AHSA1/START domain n=2 Tax=Virgibacillus TaxID=84406 RepID=A0A1H1FIH6_9BACI|nr:MULTISPECIES: SRPBCC family protein [Virgibacillus]SDR00822.1 Uncharacterized conserved protein YndB, AHSA1/START domain [Virgibacillus salinus]SEQ70557.1 Uncharacterized conserved protein YndB, AHSA1/START domain [Virgibacillus subterraneus]
MNGRYVSHDTFTIKKIYDATPATVYAAWADRKAKTRWFQKPIEFDFQVGGRETNRGESPEGSVYTFDARYLQIIHEQRIVYAYTMDLEDIRISVSLATVEFKPTGDSTQLIFTEQGAFLDGYDTSAIREQGTNTLLNNLGEELRRK